MDEGSWLIKNARIELNIRRPNRDERNALPGVVRYLGEENGIIHAMGEMNRRVGFVEISLVLVDPNSRGEGWGYKVISNLKKRWITDPIIHGLKIEEEFNGLPLICQTNNASLGKILVSSGFTIIPRRRNWKTFWLTKTNFSPISNSGTFLNHLRWFFTTILLLLLGEPLPEGSKEPKSFFHKIILRRRRALHRLIMIGSNENFILYHSSFLDDDNSFPTQQKIHIETLKSDFFKSKKDNNMVNKWDSGNVFDSEISEIIDLTE